MHFPVVSCFCFCPAATQLLNPSTSKTKPALPTAARSVAGCNAGRLQPPGKHGPTGKQPGREGGILQKRPRYTAAPPLPRLGPAPPPPPNEEKNPPNLPRSRCSEAPAETAQAASPAHRPFQGKRGIISKFPPSPRLQRLQPAASPPSGSRPARGFAPGKSPAGPAAPSPANPNGRSPHLVDVLPHPLPQPLQVHPPPRSGG